VLEKTIDSHPNIGELMKEFAADSNLKQHMKDIAAIVPKIIKSLNKVSSERKGNMLKIGIADEKAVLDSAITLFGDRFNAEVSIYSEDSDQRFDPKNRAAMAIPYQPAIYVE